MSFAVSHTIMQRAIEILEADEDIGICLECGEEQPAEKDARGYECDSCGEPEVYGAMEILV